MTSSPLILGHDPREGLQQRLVDLLTNEDVIAVDQTYDGSSAFAGASPHCRLGRSCGRSHSGAGSLLLRCSTGSEPSTARPRRGLARFPRDAWITLRRATGAS